MKPCIRVAHKLALTDNFMFLPLEMRKISWGDHSYSFYRGGLQELNGRAQQGEFDVVVVSTAAYPQLADRYSILDVGTRFANDKGPVIVTTDSSAINSAGDLQGKTVAFAGKDSSALFATQDSVAKVEAVQMSYWEIPEALLAKDVQAGVFTHDARLRYRNFPLKTVEILGKSWQQKHSVPLPVSVIAIAKSIDNDRARQVANTIRASISYALADAEETLRICLARKKVIALGKGAELSGEEAFDCVTSSITSSTLALDDSSKQGIATLTKLVNAGTSVAYAG